MTKSKYCVSTKQALPCGISVWKQTKMVHLRKIQVYILTQFDLDRLLSGFTTIDYKPIKISQLKSCRNIFSIMNDMKKTLDTNPKNPNIAELQTTVMVFM